MRAALSRIVSISSFAKMFFTYFKKNLDANSLDDDSRSLWSQDDVLETEPPFDNCILDRGEEVDLSKFRPVYSVITIFKFPQLQIHCVFD